MVFPWTGFTAFKDSNQLIVSVYVLIGWEILLLLIQQLPVLMILLEYSFIDMQLLLQARSVLLKEFMLCGLKELRST